MTRLILEYVLDGPHPGYAFTTQVDGLDAAVLKIIWQNALPRGTGWRHYPGARALKGFPLEDGRQAALADVIVTNQKDETGRRGIRRAEITVLDAADYLDALALRLAMLPEAARDEARQRLSWGRWKQIADRTAPGTHRNGGQIVLAAPYTGIADWQVMEAIVLMVATAPPLRLLSGWPRVPPLTTLALDYHAEARLVALPLAAIERLDGIRPVICT
ncbi:MAG: hypothetical protein HPY64_03795 [Anaerolineae bacterium]|nr:hypothetical protein [Anaerolineae bacterium]